MLIKKEATWKFFRGKGLQTKPEVIDEINRQLENRLNLISERALKDKIKRLGIADISLNGQRGLGETSVSSDNGRKVGEIPNPSKIKGPCSRCSGIHDRVMRMAKDIEAQINEGAVTVYNERLQNWKG